MPADSAPAAALRRSPDRGERIVWLCIQTFFLLLAVRWCARTYPGLYFPDSAFLNDLLNGGGLFTDYGYGAVLLAAAAGLGRALLAPTEHRRTAAALRLVQWASLAAVALIVCYGIYWAAGLHRLPWQEDGWGPFLGTLGVR